MNPRQIFETDAQYVRTLNLLEWQEKDFSTTVKSFSAPPGMEDTVGTVDTVYSIDQEGFSIVRIPFELSEIELKQLAKGGSIWLEILGGVPPFNLRIQTK